MVYCQEDRKLIADSFMNVKETEKDFQETLESIRRFRQTLKEIEEGGETKQTRDQRHQKVVKRSKRVPNGRQSSRQRIEFNSRPIKTSNRNSRKGLGTRNKPNLGNNNISNRNLKQFKQTLTTKVRESIGITRRGGYDDSLPLQNPVVTQGSGDSIIVTGSEFLRFVDVRSTNSNFPSVPGDIIMVAPLNPMLLPGTRIAQMATLYQKYAFEQIIFEFEPSVPSTQDGSLSMFLVYDPNENYTIFTSDQNERMRLILAHEGANIFNVYDYGRTSLSKQPDSLQSYFIREGEDARQEMQAYFCMAAASSFTNSEDSITLGSVIIHYRIKFETRAIVDPIDNSYFIQTGCVGTTLTNTFTSISQNIGVSLVPSVAMPGFVGNRSFIYLMRVISAFTVVGTSSLLVYDAFNEYTLGTQGSMWFGRTTTDSSTSPITIYSNFEQAVDAIATDAVLWKNSLTGTDTISFVIALFGLSIEDL